MQARGVDASGLRLSFEAAALAVAFDPRRSNLAFVQRELERLLTGPRLTLLPLRVMTQPAELRSAGLR